MLEFEEFRHETLPVNKETEREPDSEAPVGARWQINPTIMPDFPEGVQGVRGSRNIYISIIMIIQ